uniref:Uncharacterized protein n=1 Tax=Rhizophora mucronata TaxID=61149 RepID=A0A2P2IVX1_RHIMU
MGINYHQVTRSLTEN